MKLRYGRVLLVVGVICIVVCGIVYLNQKRIRYQVYEGELNYYEAIYHLDVNEYRFEIKGFTVDDRIYLCINDWYTFFDILNIEHQMYMNYTTHTLVYEQQKTYYFDYGHQQIRYDDVIMNLKQGHYLYKREDGVYMLMEDIQLLLLQDYTLTCNESTIILE